MLSTHSFQCNAQQAADPLYIEQRLRDDLKLKPQQKVQFRPHKKSIDARGRPVRINLSLEVAVDQELPARHYTQFHYQKVKAQAKKLLIIGAGPAGLWAALRALELGLHPIVVERGKDVQARRRDLKAINRDNVVHPDSNYCFGEGGAGTYSDGKLYTRSKKRGSIKRILDSLVAHGTDENILYEAQPHIGTNKLPKIIQALRQTILQHGGEIHFETRMEDLLLEDNLVTGIRTQQGNVLKGDALLLATGHSARDVFELLHRRKIRIEAKPFAMGVRVEHPQALINKIQYHQDPFLDYLPAASYKLVEQVADRGVYSFCMCPGGFIVPSATSQEELVVNGMSPSKRDNHFANSGIVVAVEEADLLPYAQHGPLAGLAFQKAVERAVWEAGGKTQQAAAQRLTDFVKGRASSQEDLNPSSYVPGLVAAPLHEVLPPGIAERLQIAFLAFGQKMKGYYTDQANVVGVESRTSSPVRIPRHPKTLQHPQVANLFPCGEGAGFAGGIVSAAMDGEASAEAAAAYLLEEA